jgi:hypothetical protein
MIDPFPSAIIRSSVELSNTANLDGLGAMVAPHHVAKEWSDKSQGMFDDGWDAYREKVFVGQKELGMSLKMPNFPAAILACKIGARCPKMNGGCMTCPP